jgi:hypothetical protein
VCFCLQEFLPAELTDEHIIPFSLNGAFVFRKSTCKKHQRLINEEYEQPALNSDLFVPRRLLELRRRKKKEPPKPLPPVALGNAVLSDPDAWTNLPLDLYPRAFDLIVFPPAGKLVGEDRGADLKAVRIAIVNIGGAGALDVTVRHRHSNGPFALMLAKIGYCYAAAERGVDSFEGDGIRALLRGERADVYNFVGSNVDEEHLTDRDLHHLYLRQRGASLSVLVHLFASYKVPPYEVVVGDFR